MRRVLLAVAFLSQAIANLPYFQVPSFSFSEIQSPLSPLTAEAFEQTLTSHGILAVTGVPGLSNHRAQAFRGFQTCIEAGDLSAAASIRLKDGTHRQTVEASDSEPLPSALAADCGSDTAEAMTVLRSEVRKVNEHFMHRFLETAGFHLRPRGHALSLQSLLRGGDRLEHFHHYQTNGTIEQQQWALNLHEDMGLYLAFVPALATNELSGELSADDSFHAQVYGKLHKIRFDSADSVIFMMGSGAAEWFGSAGPKPRATPHALRLYGTHSRIWYGAMVLPPAGEPVLGSGGDGQAMRYSDAVQQVVETGSVAAGCGNSRRASAEAGECTNGTIRCWMKCVVPPPCGSGGELECLNEALEGNNEQKEAACATAEGPGWAMNPKCKATCIVPPPVPAPAADLGYCQGGTDMYMNGFQWPHSGDADDQCVILLFETWTLDSQAKYFVGCIGTILLGVSLEAIIYVRRKWAKTLPKGPVRNIFYSLKVQMSHGLLYGVQLTVGYFVMLVVMTYSTPLFVCAVGGIVLGHVIFGVITSRNATKSDKFDTVADAVSPCCYNELPARRGSIVSDDEALPPSNASLGALPGACATPLHTPLVQVQGEP